MRRAALALAFCAALAAPASAWALFDDDEARARVEQLRKDVEAMQKSIDARFANAADRNAIVDLAGQIDALRSDLAKLRGQVEVLTHEMEVADKRQKDLYLDIDTRLRKLEQAQPGGGEKLPPEAAASPAETKAYEAALNQFKLGNYALAVSAFQGFLVTYPQSPLAPSAQYWIGNSLYAQHNYKGAIAAQQKVLATWPDNSKAADAMLNIASSQEALGDRRAAQRTLEGLVAKYPDSPAAASAKQRLSQRSRR